MIDVLEYLENRTLFSNLIVEGEPEAKDPATVTSVEGSSETAKKDADSPTGEVTTVYENSIDEIVVTLHKKAIEETKSKLAGLTLVNSAFDDPKNPKKLVSTGEHIISVVPEDKKTPVEQKTAIEAIKSYVQWFIGPDASKKINDKNVYPLVDDSTAKEDKDQAKTDTKKDNKPAKDETKEEPKEDKDKKETRESKQILNTSKVILVEGEPTSKNGEAPEKSDDFGQDENDSNTKKELDKNNTSDKTDDALTSSSGYFTIYTLRAFPGKKDSSVKDAAKKLGKDFIRGMRLRNWMSGTTTKSAGELYDELDDIFGKVDANELKKNISDQLKKALPGHEFEATEVYDKRSILNWLSKKLDKKDKLKIQGADYALCIKLGNDDGENGNEASIKQARNKIIKRNLSIISDIVNKSLGNVLKTIKYKIKPEHIIVTKDEGTEREKLDKVSLTKQIDSIFKKIKAKKSFDQKKIESKYGSDFITYAIAPGKVENIEDLKDTLRKLEKIDSSLTDSLISQSQGFLLIEDTESEGGQTEDQEDQSKESSDQEENTEKAVLEKVKIEVEGQAKKIIPNEIPHSIDVISSEKALEVISKEYESNEKIDTSQFDSASIIEIEDLSEEQAKDLTKEKVKPAFDETFKTLEIKNVGDVIELQKQIQKKGEEKLNSSQANVFDGIFSMLFETSEDKSDNEISKEELEEIQKEFGKIAKSALPKHDVEAKVEEGNTIIDELKENKVGNNELYGKLKDAKYIFSICAKAKDALKESFESFAFSLLDLLLEGGKTKSPREVFIGKIAHALSLKKDFLDANKEKIQKLDIDNNIKKYLVDGYKSDVKDGKLDKNTKYFEKLNIPKRDQAFKNATSKLDEIINSTDEKKAENAEIEKKEEEKKAEEKAAKDEKKPELTKFKDTLEDILKKNPKFFEKYKDELDKSEINKKIKTYLKDNLKDDYDGQHLKNTAFLKKNISDEEFKDSIEKIGKFYDEYSNSEEGKKEKEEIDNSKEDTKFSLSNNLEEKDVKAIFDEILQKFPGNIKTDTDEFYIANGEVDEKKDITKINAEWSTTYKHDQQKQDTKDNGSIQKEEVKGESVRTNVAKIICEDLIDEMILLEGSEFHKGQLSKDKVGYKTKIEAGLKRINEVIPEAKFSKILDQALRQYKDQFSRNYDKHVKSGNLKAALLDPKKFTDKMYNDFTRGELFAITVILRVILYSYYFTEVGSYALMPAQLVSKPKEEELKVEQKAFQKVFIAPFSSMIESPTDAQKEKEEPEKKEKEKEPKVEDRKKKFDFFIIPMKGLKYKDKK